MEKFSSIMKNFILMLLLGCHISKTCAISECPMMILGTQGWSVAADVTHESLVDVFELIHDYTPVHQYQFDIEYYPGLEVQRYEQSPNSWIQLNLTGHGLNYTEVLMRRDNTYILSLRPRTGGRLALKGHENLIDGSTPLSFGDSYSQFFNVETRGFEKLPTLELGRDSLLECIHISSEFQLDPANPTSDSPLKRVFAVFSVMFSESLRIRPIGQQIRDNWPNPTHISKEMALLTMYWSPMSHFIMCHRFNREWTGQDAARMKTATNVNVLADALMKVDFILWPNKFDPADLDTSCRQRRRRRKKQG